MWSTQHFKKLSYISKCILKILDFNVLYFNIHCKIYFSPTTAVRRSVLYQKVDPASPPKLIGKMFRILRWRILEPKLIREMSRIFRWRILELVRNIRQQYQMRGRDLIFWIWIQYKFFIMCWSIQGGCLSLGKTTTTNLRMVQFNEKIGRDGGSTN